MNDVLKESDEKEEVDGKLKIAFSAFPGLDIEGEAGLCLLGGKRGHKRLQKFELQIPRWKRDRPRPSPSYLRGCRYAMPFNDSLSYRDQFSLRGSSRASTPKYGVVSKDTIFYWVGASCNGNQKYDIAKYTTRMLLETIRIYTYIFF
jgi:hypothetical protein